MTNHDTGKVDAKKARIIVGDCLEVLKGFESDSIDSLVTDPPAGIGFMGKEWDHHKGGRSEWVAWMTGVMRECHRVMKPGAHGLVWAIPRTSHWTATALEDAGFEVKDQIFHLFGSGFPKSLNVKKSAEKAGIACVCDKELHSLSGAVDPANALGSQHAEQSALQSGTLPGQPRPQTCGRCGKAQFPEGYGTALKPACEVWILIRKPISEKNVASNVLKHGVGGLNIDGCRVEAADADALAKNWDRLQSDAQSDIATALSPKEQIHLGAYNKAAQGRFPANLVLSHSPHCTDEQCDIECAIKMLDEQADSKVSRFFKLCGLENTKAGDTFFYCAKISSSERNAGLEGMPKKFSATMNSGIGQREHDPNEPRAYGQNHHPTVKPQKLMRYLCRLVTPPKGVVLDPFMGSGSTGMAALSEGFRFIGIEREPEYFEIAEKRIFNHFPEAKKEVQT